MADFLLTNKVLSKEVLSIVEEDEGMRQKKKRSKGSNEKMWRLTGGTHM